MNTTLFHDLNDRFFAAVGANRECSRAFTAEILELNIYNFDCLAPSSRSKVKTGVML